MSPSEEIAIWLGCAVCGRRLVYSDSKQPDLSMARAGVTVIGMARVGGTGNAEKRDVALCRKCYKAASSQEGLLQLLRSVNA